MRLIRVAKFLRLFTIVGDQLEYAFGNMAIVYNRMFTMALLLLLLSHFGACFWWIVSVTEGCGTSEYVANCDIVINTTVGAKYAIALYWSLSSLSGFQDLIFPTTDLQLWCSFFMVIFGIVVTAVILGGAVDLIRYEDDSSRPLFALKLGSLCWP